MKWAQRRILFSNFFSTTAKLWPQIILFFRHLPDNTPPPGTLATDSPRTCTAVGRSRARGSPHSSPPTRTGDYLACSTPWLRLCAHGTAYGRYQSFTRVFDACSLLLPSSEIQICWNFITAFLYIRYEYYTVWELKKSIVKMKLYDRSHEILIWVRNFIFGYESETNVRL